ncbi:hypothetical protein ABT297_41575, partial [Dactylosporangium sp. NPDC000555]
LQDAEARLVLADAETASWLDGYGVPVPSAAEVAAAAGGGEFVWTTRQDVPFEPLIVHVDEVTGATQATVFMDTHVIAPGDAEALLRGLEAVAVEAALDPDAPTGVAAP